MKLAVVIPLYNHEAYIRSALESVLAQTRPVDRVIIVDDGSTDGSVAVARSFNDPRIAISTQKNAGAHVALNRAIAQAADCDFLAVLNSDDLFHPERLEKCVGFLERHPQLDVVCTGLKLIDSDGATLAASAPKARWAERVWAARRDDLAEWLGIANFAKTSSNFVGRQAYFASSPFRDYRYVHDYFFAVHCALQRKLGVVDEPLLFYRTHPTNTIKSVGTEMVKLETLRMNGDLLREIAPDLAGSAGVRQAYAGYFRQLMGNHSDFRAEVFLSVVAQMFAQMGPESTAALLAGLTPEAFPELTASASAVLKKQLMQEQTLSKMQKSKWLRLGRKLGFIEAL